MTAALTEAPPSRSADQAEPVAAAGDSKTVAVWTAVSRITGVVRGVVVAAVLGATVFANTYQFTNALPNLVFYGLLGGSTVSSLLIPALVRHLDRGDHETTGRVAGGFLGVVALGAAAATPVAVLVAPFALRLTSAGGDQARAGALLVLLLMPQIPLYGLVATASAVMNAKGRFGLAAAAPALENVGTVVVLGLVALTRPDIGNLDRAPLPTLLLLGLGTTGAVALHAGAQWWGARRVGVRLRPRAGWRDPQVRGILARAVPALAQAALAAVQLLVLLVLANRVAGGVVAFQLAMNFYFLPIALAATPVALSLAPRLARMTGPADAPMFRDTVVRGLRLALFLAVPAGAGYLAIATPLSYAVAYGGFGSGTALVAAGIAALAAGVVGETVFLVLTYACYAREDTRTPMRAMAVQVAVALTVAVAAVLVDGAAVPLVLGLAQSAGSLAGAAVLGRRLLRAFPAGHEPLARPLLRMAALATAMAVPAHLIGAALNDRAGGLLAVLAAALVGGAIYLGGQWSMHAPELGWLLPGRRNAARADAARGGAARGDSARADTARGDVARADAAWQGAARADAASADAARAGGAWGVAGQRDPARRDVAPRGTVAGGPRRVVARQPGRNPGAVVSGLLLVASAALGVLVGLDPLAAGGVVAALAVGAWIYLRPAVGAYLIIFLTPLTAGIDRGTLLPVLRPNEALAIFAAAVLAVRWVLTVRTGAVRLPRIRPLDGVLIGLAVCSSLVPLLMMVARQREITADDLQHTTVLWKFLAVYAIVRLGITYEKQAFRALWLSMISAAIVCVIGILQSLDLFGVPKLLGTLWAPFGVERTLAIGRGSSTLALAAAVADLAILNLAIAVGLLLRGSRHKVVLGVIAVVCLFGTLGAGEFSTVIGLLVAMAALIVTSKATRLLGYAVPLLLVGGIVMWPVIETRLSGFQSASGLPDSWIVRLHNLNTYFWPELGAHGNWLLGVRPAARVPAAHEEFGYVWIESGYTWLLWGGGLPLLGAYVAFVVVAMRGALAAARRTAGVAGVLGLTVVAVLAANVVLMLFDPHLTYRGAADAMFGVLAMLRNFDDEEPS